MSQIQPALQIIQYPHPTLRRVARPLRRVDADLHRMVRQMFDLMYEHRGIGLAATQVDLPYRLFVINLESDPAKHDQEFVFINPVLSNRKGMAEAEEGCLSLPNLYADVKRPERVTINAYTLGGQELNMELSGLFARAVQHEVDHLDGILFIDRLTPTGDLTVRPALEEFAIEFAHRRQRREIASDQEIAERLAELEKLRT
jgi:peptide deformylase